MDGASRFTQRDAVASILITSINIIAGFLIGVLQHGMDLRHALETYTVLTIGDGLVTVIPALMISISGGLIVTRASSDARLGTEFQQQIFGNSQPLLLAAGVLIALAAFPGLPKLPFLLLGGGAGAAGVEDAPEGNCAQAAAAAGGRPSLRRPRTTSKRCCGWSRWPSKSGLGLVGMVEGGAGLRRCLRRIAAIRRQLAGDLGYLLPPVRVTDNLSLRNREYVISLKGVEIARYELPQGCELAIPGGKADASLEGQPTREPAFGMSALWIPAERAERARARRLHRGGRGQRPGHAPVGVDPPPRARAVLAAGCQAPARPRSGGASQSGRGSRAQVAASRRGAARAAKPSARARLDPRRGVHSGGAGRSRDRPRAIRFC